MHEHNHFPINLQEIVSPPVDVAGPLPEAWTIADASPALRASVFALYDEIRGRFDQPDLDRMSSALQKAHYYHQRSPKVEQRTRADGTEYTTHLVAVTRILNAWDQDADTLVAGLLHDARENTQMPDGEIQAFGQTVWDAVVADTKYTVNDMVAVDQPRKAAITTDELTAETFRKLFLALGTNIRGVIVKFADRLHNIVTLRHLPKQKRRSVALQTLEYMVPVALAAGADSCADVYKTYSYTELWPKKYKKAQRLIEQQYSPEKLQQEVDTIGKAMRSMEGFVHPQDITCTVSPPGASDCLKFTAGQVEVREPPAISMDISTGTDKDFETVLQRFTPFLNKNTVQRIPKESRAAFPFPIGDTVFDLSVYAPAGWAYHRASVFDLARRLPRREEFRGDRDHKNALRLYSRNQRNARKKLENPIQLARQYERLGNATDFVRAFTEGVEHPLMIVYTPLADRRVVPRDATVLDFAHALHARIGVTATGARINGSTEVVPLSHPVYEGDVIEVVTDEPPRSNVTVDQLDAAKEYHARQVIRADILQMFDVERMLEAGDTTDAQVQLEKMNLTAEELYARCGQLHQEATKRGNKKIQRVYANTRDPHESSEQNVVWYRRQEPKGNMHRVWKMIPQRIRTMYTDINQFLQACGLDLAGDGDINRFVLALIRYEDAQPEFSVLVPDHRSQLARIASVIGVFGNIIDVGQEKYTEGIPPGSVRLRQQVECKSPEAELRLREILPLMEKQMNVSYVLKKDTSNRQRKFQLVVPDQTGLLGQIGHIIAPFANITDTSIFQSEGGDSGGNVRLSFTVEYTDEQSMNVLMYILDVVEDELQESAQEP